MAGSERSSATTVALIGAAATIIAALIGGVVALSTSGGGSHSSQTSPKVEVSFPPVTLQSPSGSEPSVFLSKESGPGGSQMAVSGKGFDPNEQVVIRFHTDQVASTQADGTGQFANVVITVPTSYSKFAPQQFDVVATGQSSDKAAQAPFEISG